MSGILPVIALVLSATIAEGSGPKACRSECEFWRVEAGDWYNRAGGCQVRLEGLEVDLRSCERAKGARDRIDLSMPTPAKDEGSLFVPVLVSGLVGVTIGLIGALVLQAL